MATGPSSFLSMTKTTPVLGGAESKIKTSPTSQDDGLNDVPEYDENHDEGDGGRLDAGGEETGGEDYGGGTQLRPVGTKINRSTDKRKFGGSSKGRKCFRWTKKQEKAAIDGMLEIRAEGEIIGDACFSELYKRLVAKHGSDWNHSVSGIHNAWHRRKLAKRVYRAEAEVEQQQCKQEEQVDQGLSLLSKDKREWEYKSSDKLAKQVQRERSDEDIDESMADEEPNVSSKWVRLHNTQPRPSLSISPSTLRSSLGSSIAPFSPPATVSPFPAIPKYPTVTVHFKRYNNSSRRARVFADIDTMHKFWNQVIAAPCFDNLETAFRVVDVTINNGKKPLNMAQHDKVDYSDFLERLERVVDAAGEGPVIVDVKAVGLETD